MRRYRSCSQPQENEQCVNMEQRDVPSSPCTPTNPTPVYTDAIGKAPVLVSMLDAKAMVTNVVEMPEGAFAPTVMDRSLVDVKMHVMPEANMLFIKGMVRTNMAYTMPECVDDDSVVGNLMHMTMNCEFEYSTEIDYNMCPPTGIEPRMTLRADMKDPCYPCQGNMRNPEFQQSIDKLNRPMVAELMDCNIMATVTEDRDLLGADYYCSGNGVNVLNDDDGCKLREDIVIEMKIAIYQDQFVRMG